MNMLIAVVAVVGLFLIGLFGGTPGVRWLFAVALPYTALALFVVGLVYRILSWANAPVPFRIPTTSGQQKSLSWIRQEKLDNPHNTLTVIGRMALEVLFFRSLLKNTKTELVEGSRLVYATDLGLWLAGDLLSADLPATLRRELSQSTALNRLCHQVGIWLGHGDQGAEMRGLKDRFLFRLRLCERARDRLPQLAHYLWAAPSRLRGH